MGRVRMQGPTWNELDAHEQWHQIYIVLSGTGTMVIGDEKIAINGPTVIQIPDNTTHYMKLADGEEMVTVYVNRFVH